MSEDDGRIHMNCLIILVLTNGGFNSCVDRCPNRCHSMNDSGFPHMQRTWPIRLMGDWLIPTRGHLRTSSTRRLPDRKLNVAHVDSKLRGYLIR